MDVEVFYFFRALLLLIALQKPMTIDIFLSPSLRLELVRSAILSLTIKVPFDDNLTKLIIAIM
jgi:hypothetical protein